MNKYLIYKVSGGLNHMLIQISNAIELSIITNRILIIDCYSGAFCNDFNKYFKIPNFEYHTNYEILKNEKFIDQNELQFLISSSVKYIDGDYFLGEKKINYEKEEILSITDDLIVMTAIKHNFEYHDRIRVNSNILEEIKKLGEIKENHIGVHYRNTDMKHDLEEIVNLIKKQSIKKLYFSTDDYSSIQIFKNLLPNYEVIQYTIPPETNGGNIHYGHDDKHRIIMNALIDIYYLMKSTIFIPSKKSSFSKMVNRLRKKDYFFTNGHGFINKYFDKVYVLNLDRRPDRLLKISEKLEKMDIRFERFTAIDGQNIPNVPDNYKSRNLKENQKFEIGCLLSHLSILKIAKENSYKKILILEDDVFISRDIKNFENYIKNIQSWKLLYLGASQYNWNVEMCGNSFYYSKESLGTFAYAIHEDVYDDIIEELEKLETTVDNSISKIQKKHYKNCFTFFPNLIIADISESDIRENRLNNEMHIKKMKWDLLNNYI